MAKKNITIGELQEIKTIEFFGKIYKIKRCCVTFPGKGKSDNWLVIEWNVQPIKEGLDG